MHFPGYGVRVVVFVPLSITFDTFSSIVENCGILSFDERWEDRFIVHYVDYMFLKVLYERKCV